MSEAGNGEAGPKRFGAFLGVFTPTVLTILGVIMYLRLGWVVGNAGLWGALAIIAFSNVITLVTALSMSTLATNMRVGVGGAYFLISRSFGLEIGGAIGIPLYLSQVLSVTLYAYGLAESLRVLWAGLPVMPVAAVIVILVGAVAARSTELTLKLQLPIMALIAASIISLVLGVDFGASKVPAVGGFTEATPMLTFAVFFPAVTGILTGLSLSGDLADPSRSIPVGGLSAVAVGAVVYLSLPFVLASGASTEQLVTEPLIWTTLAVAPWLIMPGMWGAILSSAFGAILSAPRTLQALADDRLAPSKFAEVDEATGEPMIGLYVSGALALAAVGFGSLDDVATVVTMFFLTTYGALNLVACLESLIGDPSFRPTIRIPWWVSLFGAAGCFLAMFAISPPASMAAVAIEIGIFSILSRRSLEATWGDARGGLLLTGARAAVMRLRDARIDPRNWRPHIIVLTPDLDRDVPVVEFADDLGHHRGITTVAHLVVGDEDIHDEARQLIRRNRNLLEDRGLGDVFSEVDIVGDFERGAVTVVQANGIAGLDSNTAFFGYHPEDGQGPEDLAKLFVLARRMGKLDKCTVIMRPARGAKRKQNDKPVLMIWWAGRENNGDLMLLLAHLMSVSRNWRGARIQLKSICATEEEAIRRRREFAQMMPEIRIAVEIDILQRGERKVSDIIREESMSAHFVFFGLYVPEPGNELEYAQRIEAMLDGLPPAALVRNDGDFRGRLV